ncbi:MAG TPA: peptidyl-prolyl cis-trans isomerase, partial [Balneolaceae bacterium]|nr:peptidyl-prolyl cis-trans isomerase [Balneolaceae bacterium]
MEKMRKGTGVILWVLIISFGLLWVLADTNFFGAIMRGSGELGAVNGEGITLQEYNSRVSSYIEQYSRRTGNSVTPEMRAFYEQRAWNDIVTGKLVQQKMDELGITVTDQEVVEMITGPNPDPFIRRQFANEDGSINRVALRAAIEAPENTQLWIAIEQQMRQKRRQQKMGNYLRSAIQISDYEVKQQFIRNNTFADVSYIRFPYANVDESEITVTEADLRDYYESHQEQYKRNETYRFKYVSFDKSPTAADTARTLELVKDLRSEFAAAENDSLFLNSYLSTTAYSAEMVDKSSVRDLFKPVLDLEEGEVSEVIKENGRYYLLKKLDETEDQVKFVVFSKDVVADPIATIDAQAGVAGDFSFFANESNFLDEAERRDLKVSEAFATKGNSFISGIGQSRQITNFLETAEEGQISEPIELPGQFVVIKVSEITPKGVRPFEEVKEQIQTIVTNEKRKQQVANYVSELLAQNESLEALADAAGKEISTVENLAMNSFTIEGAGREPRVVGAIFGLNEGERSGPVKGVSAVFVVKVNSLNKANADSLTEERKEQIRQQL